MESVSVLDEDLHTLLVRALNCSHTTVCHCWRAAFLAVRSPESEAQRQYNSNVCKINIIFQNVYLHGHVNYSMHETL